MEPAQCDRGAARDGAGGGLQPLQVGRGEVDEAGRRGTERREEESPVHRDRERQPALAPQSRLIGAPRWRRRGAHEAFALHARRHARHADPAARGARCHQQEGAATHRDGAAAVGGATRGLKPGDLHGGVAGQQHGVGVGDAVARDREREVARDPWHAAARRRHRAAELALCHLDRRMLGALARIRLEAAPRQRGRHAARQEARAAQGDRLDAAVGGPDQGQDLVDHHLVVDKVGEDVRPVRTRVDREVHTPASRRVDNGRCAAHALAVHAAGQAR